MWSIRESFLITAWHYLMLRNELHTITYTHTVNVHTPVHKHGNGNPPCHHEMRLQMNGTRRNMVFFVVGNFEGGGGPQFIYIYFP